MLESAVYEFSLYQRGRRLKGRGVCVRIMGVVGLSFQSPLDQYRLEIGIEKAAARLFNDNERFFDTGYYRFKYPTAGYREYDERTDAKIMVELAMVDFLKSHVVPWIPYGPLPEIRDLTRVDIIPNEENQNRPVLVKRTKIY